MCRLGSFIQKFQTLFRQPLIQIAMNVHGAENLQTAAVYTGMGQRNVQVCILGWGWVGTVGIGCSGTGRLGYQGQGPGKRFSIWDLGLQQ